MAVTHLDMEREFLLLLSTKVIPTNTGLATVECLKELQTQALAYLDFLPIHNWAQALAECLVAIDEIIENLKHRYHVQLAMHDLEFMYSPVYQSQLHQVNKELPRKQCLRALTTVPLETPA